MNICMYSTNNLFLYITGKTVSGFRYDFAPSFVNLEVISDVIQKTYDSKFLKTKWRRQRLFLRIESFCTSYFLKV